MRNVTPSKLPRLLTTLVTVAVIVGLFLLFPRLLAFTELAARELRYFWWLILLVALSTYFFFFFGKKKP
ncbi:MAG: hypothetical protein RL376_1272 [Verrucomicrobiota bacterium]|jgi:hypothetical protein